MSQHKGRFGWYLSFAVLVQMLVGGVAGAQVKSYKPGEYPAPKDPPYKTDVTVDELLPMARVLVRKPAERQPLVPGYGIKPGQRVLILVASSFDDTVLEAIRRAIAEVGGRPDVMKTWAPERANVSANHGHLEIRAEQISGRENRAASRGSSSGFARALMSAGKDSSYGQYDLILNGSGGPVPVTPFGWEYIPWDTVDKFMFGQAGFPYEVQKAIDDKAWNTLLQSRQIHNTDPEGTDMTWNWQPNFAALLREEWPGYDKVLAGHISPVPLLLSPKEINANGVIGGTINHTGSFPRVVLTIKDNVIVKIEGGAEYGKKWQEVLEACRNTQYPGFPSTGCGWFEESSIGTDVWRARSLQFADYPGGASWERGRTGVIHFGLGTSRNLDALPAVVKWLEENNPPGGGGHWHVHTYFNTMDFTLNDGKQFRLIDKGHLTVLDDPQVRQIAAKYGDPDEMLTEKWIPGIPGINMPGNYLTDYAPDPYKVIAAHLAEIKRNLRGASQEGSGKSAPLWQARSR